MGGGYYSLMMYRDPIGSNKGHHCAPQFALKAALSDTLDQVSVLVNRDSCGLDFLGVNMDCFGQLWDCIYHRS